MCWNKFAGRWRTILRRPKTHYLPPCHCRSARWPVLPLACQHCWARQQPLLLPSPSVCHLSRSSCRLKQQQPCAHGCSLHARLIAWACTGTPKRKPAGAITCWTAAPPAAPTRPGPPPSAPCSAARRTGTPTAKCAAAANPAETGCCPCHATPGCSASAASGRS